MPTTVTDIFQQFDLKIVGQVKWQTEIKSDNYGVYVIALTNDRDKFLTLDKLNFDETVIINWLELIKTFGKTLMVDGKPATLGTIKQRLSQLWLPDETIVYIGKAGPTKGRTLRKRVNEFYQTKLGCNKCHAGGHWLNTLQRLSDLNIYYSETDPNIEEEMINYFAAQVSEDSKSRLYDKTNCFPFANKELNKRIRKVHGLSNQTIDCGSKWKKLEL